MMNMAFAKSEVSQVVAACPGCGAEQQFETVGRGASAFHCTDAGGLAHPPYEVRECRACGLFYKSHLLSAAGLDTYYRTIAFTPFDGDYGFPTDRALLTQLRRLPTGTRVLDFGCSTGRILSSLGSRYQRFGVEIGEAAAAAARSKGIAMISEEVLTSGSAGLFSGIIITDVFEHLVQPTQTLRTLSKCLEPGGRLFIVTGLADAVRPRELTAEHWYFRIGGHLQMLSRRHLDWLADILGLEIASAQILSHYRRTWPLHVKQQIQAMLYERLSLTPRSVTAALVRSTPGFARAAKWSNLPSTEQVADHIVVVLRKADYD